MIFPSENNGEEGEKEEDSGDSNLRPGAQAHFYNHGEQFIVRQGV